ncbi:MAG: homoserine O-succinyltransferase [Firmicutes bacterium]|nr:homoserine O-succinyltransferase [Bacillota bacterium]
MPICIPNDLPATETLHKERVFVIHQTRANTQDIRPLEILLLNLMPTKIVTETQIARLLANSPLQVNLELLHTSSYESKNTSREHMLAFYKTFDQVKDRNFDGMIITGAPVENMPFEEVAYWDELKEIMEWSKTHVYSTLHICWGAQAALYYHYGVPKYPLTEKMFGIFPHQMEEQNSILFRGFDDVFMVPHSRHTTIKRVDLLNVPQLQILCSSDEAGIYAVATPNGRQIFLTGHLEYDADTLEREYLRDKNAGLPISVPKNYYPNDDDSKRPIVTWRGNAHLLFSNWLNYYVYQGTPYDLDTLE